MIDAKKDDREELVAVGNRLRAAIGSMGAPKAAQIAGVTEQTFRRWLAGTNQYNATKLRRLTDALGISLDSVILGDEAAANGQLSDDLVHVDLERQPVSAGSGAMVAEDDEPTRRVAFRQEWLRRYFGDPGNLAMLPVRGDSMFPELADGDIVMIDKQVTKKGPDGLYVVLFDDQLFVKRIQSVGVGVLRLISSNPAYSPIEIDLGRHQDGFKIVGRVVWMGKRVT